MIYIVQLIKIIDNQLDGFIMNKIKALLTVFLLFFVIISCNDQTGLPLNDDPRLATLIDLKNFTNDTSCPVEETVTFILTYSYGTAFGAQNAAEQVDATLEAGQIGSVIVTVYNNTPLNVKVQRTSDDTFLAESNVTIRTESRPVELKDATRKITYCDLDLIFENF